MAMSWAAHAASHSCGLRDLAQEAAASIHWAAAHSCGQAGISLQHVGAVPLACWSCLHDCAQSATLMLLDNGSSFIPKGHQPVLG